MAETNIDALKKLVKVIADAAKDTVAAAQPGESVVQRLMNYQNLVGDVIAVIPSVGEIPSEVADLSAEDYAALAKELVTDLGIADQHIAGIVNASLALVNDIIEVVVPDVNNLLAAVKAPQAT